MRGVANPPDSRVNLCRHRCGPGCQRTLQVILTLTLPRIMEGMDAALVRKVHGAVGTELAPGAKLVDLSIDLSAVAPHDCPPITLYRVALRERAWLRALNAPAGSSIEPGCVLARFSTTPDEPLGQSDAREVRVTIAGISHPPEWWEDDTS